MRYLGNPPVHNATLSCLLGILTPREEQRLRTLIGVLEMRTQGICPICHGGVNHWGHTSKCPLTVLSNALHEAMTEQASPPERG